MMDWQSIDAAKVDISADVPLDDFLAQVSALVGQAYRDVKSLAPHCFTVRATGEVYAVAIPHTITRADPEEAGENIMTWLIEHFERFGVVRYAFCFEAASQERSVVCIEAADHSTVILGIREIIRENDTAHLGPLKASPTQFMSNKLIPEGRQLH